MRVLHVGLDGGSFGVLDALADRGVMPAYARLRRAGASAPLASTTPWFTVPAWISWMTGVSAERHGLIYWTATSASDYWERRGEATRFVRFDDIVQPSVFEIVSSAGRRVASVNMPVTFPPPAVNGVMVAGYLAPLDPARVAYPSGFLSRYPRYAVDDDGPVGAVGRSPEDPDAMTGDAVEAYVRRLADIAEERHRVLADLLADGVDLASVVYVGPDRLSHVAWPEVAAVMQRPPATAVERAVEDYYGRLDRLLADAMALLEPDDLFLVTSDHGQGPPASVAFAANAWLREQGLLAMRSATVRRSARLIPGAWIRRRLWALWRRGRNIPKDVVPFVDWDRTSAYAVSLGPCSAFGIAVRGDDALQRNLADRLREIRTPGSGERLVEEVLFASEICVDEGRGRYPELVVILRPDAKAVVRQTSGPWLADAPAGRGGLHEREGILLASGGSVATGVHAECDIVDVAPTILAAFGIEAAGMDGKIIPWVAGEGAGDRRAVPSVAVREPRAALTGEDERQIAAHLQELGYLD